MTAADGFTKRRFAWLDQVLADHTLPANAFPVAYVIAGCLNRKTGDAWPSLDTIARCVGRSTRRIQDAIDALEKAGHLTSDQRGRGKTNRYRIALQDRTETSSQDVPPRPDETVRPKEPKTGQKRPAKENKTGHFRQDDRTVSSGKTGQFRPIHIENPLNEPFEEPIEEGNIYPGNGSSNRGTLDEQFAEFYRHFPRKKQPEAAKKAFGRVIRTKKATANELIAGAMRYAAERDGQDPKFTKHPATWLNGGGWLDEPDNPRRAQSSGKPQTTSDVFRELEERERGGGR